MRVTLEEFVKQLEDSGVISPAKLQPYIPPQAAPKSAEDLAKELVGQHHLTKFQAQEIYLRRAKSLILGNYTILDKIGAGGMGQVFKAQHRKMERIVAIKMLPPAMLKDAAAAARFQREVVAAAKLRHPNIVAADDAAEANGNHFLVMEYVEGQDLSALVKKNGPFPVAKAVNCILQAARGLEFAHKKGVIHRDIKPSNLLLDLEGTVKILDMGLARIATEGNAETQAELTGTGMVMGTVDYMSPEQALDTKTADARADIYALGCSLYYLLTAKAAYHGDTLMAKLLAHREKPIPSLRATCLDVPEEVEAVFRKMVAKTVQGRYQTMTEVIAALEQIGAGPPTSPSIQQSASTNFDDSALMTFLKDAPTRTTHRTRPTKTVAAIKSGDDKQPPWKNTKVLIGAGVLGVVILAGIIVSLPTKDGTLIVEVDQPDAMVQVLDAEGKVEVSQKGGGKVTISVDPGKHRLKVQKDGFVVFGQEFEMESGGKKSITAKLVAAGNKPAPVVGTKKPLFFQTAGFEPWAKEVAAMSAEKQVEAVSKKLVELNPGFDGKIKGWDGYGQPNIENGVVTVVSFASDNVADLSPVRALKGLKVLYCPGSDLGKGRLSDLSPLTGLPLKALRLNYTLVSDLSPLMGMPLTSLDLQVTRVSELKTLRGMPLLERLLFSGSPVSDLSPLKGMPLASLDCSNTQVSDLSPLEGMKLSALLIGRTKITDLSPLKEMSKLESLLVEGTQVSDLSPLQGMPLKQLRIHSTQVSDLSSLKDMPLTSLHCDFNPFRDTELLRSIKTLETINGKPSAEFWKEVAEKQAAFQQWMKDVAAMPAEQQVVAVSKKLVELNPGFDGKVTPTIQEGVVTELVFSTDNVNDISPVRALAGLKFLNCSGSDFDKGKLSDLSPLKGMPLLTELVCQATQVSDLSPLKGMRLNVLNFPYTQVSDLSPLNGMPLTILNCNGTQVSDLSPLKGMLLVSLGFINTQVADMSPLKGMPLRELAFQGTQVSDLTPLRGMPLYSLSCSKQVSDLRPLKGMPLAYLACSLTQVSDLSPLKDMKLLTTLRCDSTPVSDFSLLRDMPLKELSLDFKPFRDTELIRSIKSLETINRKPTAEFWKEVGEKQAAFAQWMKDVASMPAEQQVEAVSKKLVELNPGFDGKITPTIQEGVVTDLTFVTDNVTNISPVRALVGLKFLICSGSDGGKGKLSDLSPLKGMRLNVLNFPYTQVSDLSPLNGMPLHTMSFSGTPVSDLSPLKGMLLGSLSFVGTQVADLSPLKGMPLKELAFQDTQVSDLTPLRGMPLGFLNCATNQVSDLTPLKGMPLGYLICSGTQVSDLSPLKDMKLLTTLRCDSTPVSDLSPLKGVPLTFLVCNVTQVSDLSPIKDMPLKELSLDFKPERDTDILRSIKTLENINGKPAAEFWKEVEDKQKK